MLLKNKLALYLLSISLSLSFISCQVLAKGKSKGRRYYRQAAPSGGLFLKTPNPTTPVEHNNRGVELGQKGLWSDAIKEHEIALEMDPHDSTWRTNLSAAHLEYGKTLASQGRKDLACAEFRRAMIIDPANAAADAELDRVLASLKRNPSDYNYRKSLAEDADASAQYDTAIVEWRKCIKIRDDALSHAQLGRVLMKAGKDVDGFKELRLAVGRSDWTAEQRLELATVHRQIGDLLKDYAYKAKNDGRGTKGMQRLANAAIEYRRAAILNPGDLNAVEGLLQCAREAVAIKPQSFDNHMMLAGAYLLNADFAHAQMEYKECYKLGAARPELTVARTAYHLAVARSPRSSDTQVADSVNVVKKLVDDYPEDPRLWYILGRLRERQNDFERAGKCYAQSLKYSNNTPCDPDIPQALVRIGVGAPATVASAANSQVPAAPTKTPEQAKAEMAKFMKEKAYVDAQNLLESGKFDEALKQLEEMFQKDSKDGRVAGLMGLAYEKKGELDQAKVWYRMGSNLGDANSSRFMDQIDAGRIQKLVEEGEKLRQAQEWLKAASIYRDALIISPKRVDLHRYLAECLNKIGDKESAKKELDIADRIDKGLPESSATESSFLSDEKKESNAIAEQKAESAAGLKADMGALGSAAAAPKKKK